MWAGKKGMADRKPNLSTLFGARKCCHRMAQRDRETLTPAGTIRGTGRNHDRPSPIRSPPSDDYGTRLKPSGHEAVKIR